MQRLRLRSRRRSRTIAAVAATVGLSLTAAPSLGTAAATAAPDGNGRAAAPAVGQQRLVPPGPAGPTIVLEDQASFHGVDIATDPSTNISYVGWISANAADTQLRQVHLCVLPVEATACTGGVLTTSGIDGPSADGLQVEVTAPGVVTLVWFHQSGLTTGKIATATYANGVLSPSVDVADAPSFGQLFDVVVGPDGQLWALTANASGTGENLQVRQGLAGVPQNIVAPWYVGRAQLAFHGSKPIVLAGKAGSIADPLHFATGIPWTGFSPIPKTWTLGVANDIVGTKKGVRMIGSENAAGYRPVVGRWTGSAFSTPKLVGDNTNCPGLSRDLVTDSSGRLADVGSGCDKINVYNLPNTKQAAIARFATGGTLAEAPQISTTSRGYAWVAWGILSSVQANKLLVRPVRLPALMKSKGAKAKGNKVIVQGPVSCLPVVTVKGRLKTNPAKGWSVVSKQLKLDGDNVANPVKIDGEKLASGSTHQLVGKAVFRKGGQQVTVTKKFSFKVC